MNWFHTIKALLLLNLGIFGFAQETDDNDPTEVCGKPLVVNSRIVGGHNTKKGQNPWQVILWLPGKYHCGGTLIRSNFVVTAAHCVKSVNASSVIVILGAYKITGNHKEEVPVPVKRIIIHPKYNESDHSNDVALLELSRNVPFTNFILPACLPPSPTLFLPGHSCVVTGWGVFQFNSTKPMPVILKEAEVRLISLEDCKHIFKLAINQSVITDDMICAMDISGKIGACMGDNGGPLICYENESWHLVGISFGFGCGLGIPGIYSSVPAHIEWIRSYIRAASSASKAMESMPGVAIVVLALTYFIQVIL